MLNSRLTHRRTINSKYGTNGIEWLQQHVDPNAKRWEGKPKLKYLLPLDDDLLESIRRLAKSYPTKRVTSKENVVPGDHPGEGGVIPTVALQIRIVKH